MSLATVTVIAGGARSVMASGSAAALSTLGFERAGPQRIALGPEGGRAGDLHDGRRGRQSGLALLGRGAADLEDEALRCLGRHLRHRRLDIFLAGPHPQQALLQLMVVGQLMGRHLAQDAPVHHHRDAARDRCRHAEVLLDEQHRDGAFLGQPRQHLDDLVDDDRRQPLGRLVHHQQARIAQEAAADGQHLLLAAGELGAAVAPALGQAREGLVDALDGPGPLGAFADQAQMLVHREGGPDAPALRDIADAHIDDLIGRQAQDLRPRRGGYCRRWRAPAP